MAAVSTSIGGYIAVLLQRRVYALMAFGAGVLVGAACLDLLPSAFSAAAATGSGKSLVFPIAALGGLLIFCIGPWTRNFDSVTKDYPHEQLIQNQLEKVGVVARRGQTVNGLDTQIGLVEAELGVAVIPSFGAIASRNRKVRISKLEPEVGLEFYEISNRGRKLPSEASGFASFLKTFLARQVGEHHD
ncbi:MAG: LysR substrate-binding domain-containing protein [Acidobacteriaceae bacterium]